MGGAGVEEEFKTEVEIGNTNYEYYYDNYHIAVTCLCAYTVEPLYKGHCIKDTSLMRTLSAVHPMVASIERFHCIQDSQLGPNGGLYREVPLYTGQPAGSQWCPL